MEDTVDGESWLAGTPPAPAALIRKEIARLPAPDLGGVMFEHGGLVRLRIRIYVARRK